MRCVFKDMKMEFFIYPFAITNLDFLIIIIFSLVLYFSFLALQLFHIEDICLEHTTELVSCVILNLFLADSPPLPFCCAVQRPGDEASSCGRRFSRRIAAGGPGRAWEAGPGHTGGESGDFGSAVGCARVTVLRAAVAPPARIGKIPAHCWGSESSGCVTAQWRWQGGESGLLPCRAGGCRATGSRVAGRKRRRRPPPIGRPDEPPAGLVPGGSPLSPRFRVGVIQLCHGWCVWTGGVVAYGRHQAACAGSASRGGRLFDPCGESPGIPSCGQRPVSGGQPAGGPVPFKTDPRQKRRGSPGHMRASPSVYRSQSANPCGRAMPDLVCVASCMGPAASRLGRAQNRKTSESPAAPRKGPRGARQAPKSALRTIPV